MKDYRYFDQSPDFIGRSVRVLTEMVIPGALFALTVVQLVIVWLG